jgi:hypothetical protein
MSSETSSLISTEREEYNRIRVKYLSIANKMSDDFARQYSSLFRDIDELHEKCTSVALKYLMTVVDEAIRDLIAHGIYDINEDEFINAYLSDYYTWDNDFAEVDERYLEIVLSAEQLDEYRIARRENRGRWIGGGFGISGAIKGAAGAAAANLAIGAVHGVFNLAAKGMTAIGNSYNKSELFQDLRTKTHLVESLCKLLFNVHFAFVRAANDRKPGTISGVVAEEERNKATRLLENVSKGRIVGDRARDVIREAILLNPYNTDAYRMWLERYDDSDGLLKLTAQHYGINEVNQTKQSVAVNESKEVHSDSSSTTVIPEKTNKIFPVTLFVLVAAIVIYLICDAHKYGQKLASSYAPITKPSLQSPSQSIKAAADKEPGNSGGINFHEVKERFVKSAVTDDILVISGLAVNEYEFPVDKVKLRGGKLGSGLAFCLRAGPASGPAYLVSR